MAHPDFQVGFFISQTREAPMKLRITRPIFQGAQMLAPGIIVDVPASVADVYLRQKAAVVLEDGRRPAPVPPAPGPTPGTDPAAAKPERSRKKHAQAQADR